jgi:CrcB protein
MPVAISVAVFGALGALSRYGADVFIERHTATVFPLSTFVINVTGCVLAGLLVGGVVDRFHEPTWLTVGVVTGFLGAYTTFSTFAFETHDLMRGSHMALALLNVVGSVTAGIAGVALGLLLVGRY